VRLSRCGVRDHVNYSKNDRWRSYRFYRALQRLKSSMRNTCEIFGASIFEFFNTIGQFRKSARASATSGRPPTNGHHASERSLPKSANNGSDRGYSITSSAVASSVEEMVRPGAIDPVVNRK
jgi:hypothetical protein